MISDYVIISDTNPETLSKKVRDYSRQGWECQGGVAVLESEEEGPDAEDYRVVSYHQAMVNPVEEKPTQ